MSEAVGWLKARAERTVETACARIFLEGELAWKVKRAADLGYADFSTLERRLWALERELVFNQPAAPDIYKRVRRITRTAGGLEFDGPGEVVEYALEMRRFDDDGVLGAHPERIDGAMAELLGRTIAGFHATAELRPAGGLTALSWTIGSNAGLLRGMKPELGAERVDALIALTEAELERQAPLLAHRAATGFSRRCHGDLHLANILVEDGRPILFDCIEFSDLLSDLDVLYDLAFLLMDLDFRGRRDAAVRVLSAYLDEAGRSFPAEIWDGLAALPLMLSARAAVRAHVAAHAGDLAQSKAYIDAGIAHLSPGPPRLMAVGGLSGSGKSSFARTVAPYLGASPGAVVLRTDEVRKRLLNVPPTQKLDDRAYSPEFYNRSYDTLMENGRQLLAAGRSVVLDATFIDPGLRARAEGLARDCGVPFDGIWLEAPLDVLKARVAKRKNDASDATLATLDDQLERLKVEASWERVDTSGAAKDAAAKWARRHGL